MCPHKDSGYLPGLIIPSPQRVHTHTHTLTLCSHDEHPLRYHLLPLSMTQLSLGTLCPPLSQMSGILCSLYGPSQV